MIVTPAVAAVIVMMSAGTQPLASPPLVPQAEVHPALEAPDESVEAQPNCCVIPYSIFAWVHSQEMTL